MNERISFTKAAPAAYKAMLGLHGYLENCGLDHQLLNLVFLRASQMNGCAFCIDMHWKDLRGAGVNEQHLYMANAWREWHGYSGRERAALEWTEAVTHLSREGVPDDIYSRVREHFSETELANLTLAVGAINVWNRLNVAFRKEAGEYQPARVAAQGANSK
jgi:AhpD family alkylhydroperoxidase